MSGLHSSDWLSHWRTHVDGLPVDDDAIRTFAHLLQAYLARDVEDREDLAVMAGVVTDPSSDADDVQAALDTLRESLHSTAEGVDLEAGDDLDEAEREVGRRMDAEEANFADRLGAIMAAKGMSQSQLARASGVGQPAISMMLTRNCRPQRRTVERLSRALDVAPGDLWPATAPRTSEPAAVSDAAHPAVPEIDRWANVESRNTPGDFPTTSKSDWVVCVAWDVGLTGPRGPKAAA